ncbi:MAG: cytochrome c [Bacteroidia bacterium]|nr:cytochrome c [Bacteroidia bacterium]
MKYFVSSILVLAVLAFSCGGGETKTTPKKAPTANKPKAEKVVSPGKKVYMANCATCHLQNGKGMPSLYPPLSKTEWVSGDNARLINVVLLGLKGEIEVNGEKYNNVMTPYASLLSDQEIADVLTYVRSSFGNDYPAITPAEVKAERDKL